MSMDLDVDEESDPYLPVLYIFHLLLLKLCISMELAAFLNSKICLTRHKSAHIWSFNNVISLRDRKNHVVCSYISFKDQPKEGPYRGDVCLSIRNHCIPGTVRVILHVLFMLSLCSDIINIIIIIF